LRDLIEFTRARPQLLGPDTIAGARRGAERLSALLPRQLSHDAPDRLRLRLDPGEVADAAARRAAGEVARRALRAYLAQQGLPDVRVTVEGRPPVADVPSGKRRQVIVTPSA
jgi:hypothetical protein